MSVSSHGPSLFTQGIRTEHYLVPLRLASWTRKGWRRSLHKAEYPLLVPGKQILYMLLQKREKYFLAGPMGSAFDFHDQWRLQRFCDEAPFLSSLSSTNIFNSNMIIIQGETCFLPDSEWRGVLHYRVYFMRGSKSDAYIQKHPGAHPWQWPLKGSSKLLDSITRKWMISHERSPATRTIFPISAHNQVPFDTFLFLRMIWFLSNRPDVFSLLCDKCAQFGLI